MLLIVLKNPELLKEDLLKIGTITSAGEYTGYSKAYISSIISGVRNPNANVAIRLCELTEQPFEKYFFIQNVHKKITKR